VPPIRIAVVGDSCIDVYAGLGRSAVGGNALNVAVGLATRGLTVEYIGEVGNDEAGRRVLDAAQGAGVGTARVHMEPGSTWKAYISVRGAGAARVEHEAPGAGGPYWLRDGELEVLEDFDHVHMANLADPAAVIAELHALGVSTSYDYGKWARPETVAPDIVFASAEEPGAMARAEEMAGAARAHGARLVVVTLGAGGSVGFGEDGRHRLSAQRLVPVDTLGAGDSYIAAFLASHLAGASLEQAMRTAGAAASATCLHWAAWPQPGLPTLSGGVEA
jgi:fructoselysine 6-kinase